MTSHPNTTTDGPDALTDDSPDMETATAEDDAPVTPPPAESPPGQSPADESPADQPAGEAPADAPARTTGPASFTDDIPTEAGTRDANAAAAAAALFGDDALPDAASGNAADGISAAEREYQEAMRTAQALGFDEEAPTAAIDAEAASAAELAERLGLEESKEPAAPPEPEPEDVAARIAAAEADEILGPDIGDGRAWYVLNTYSGHENKVDENLKRRVESMDVADRIFDVVVPTEEELEIRGGQRRQVQRKLLPGYVLVNMLLDDDTWYVVRNTPGVTGFVGAEKPHPLPRQEVAAILKQTRVAEPRVRVGFEIGDMVRVMEGPFQDFSGEVDEINLEKGKVRVMISMFGRDTPVELDFMQVEKV